MGLYGPISTLWNGGADELEFPADQLKLYGCVNFTKETCACGFKMSKKWSFRPIINYARPIVTAGRPRMLSSKVSWASLGELIYHFFGTDLLRSIFNRQFRKVFLLMLKKIRKDCIVISGRSKTSVDRWPYMGVFAVLGDIGLCHWPHRWVDGEQCKCKYWFVF